MSVGALLRATYAQLETDLTFPGTTANYLGIRGSGRPPAKCGQEFVAVHPTLWSFGPSGDQHMGFDEVFALSVTVTHRTGKVPDDQTALAAFIGAQHGLPYSLEARARQIVVSIHKNRYAIMTAAEALTGTGGFTEPLWFNNADPFPIVQGPDWFTSDDAPANYGLSLELRFGGPHGGARRLQEHDTME